jgi:hypothetical protein
MAGVVGCLAGGSEFSTGNINKRNQYINLFQRGKDKKRTIIFILKKLTVIHYFRELLHGAPVRRFGEVKHLAIYNDHLVGLGLVGLVLLTFAIIGTVTAITVTICGRDAPKKGYMSFKRNLILSFARKGIITKLHSPALPHIGLEEGH